MLRASTTENVLVFKSCRRSHRPCRFGRRAAAAVGAVVVVVRPGRSRQGGCACSSLRRPSGNRAWCQSPGPRAPVRPSPTCHLPTHAVRYPMACSRVPIVVIGTGTPEPTCSNAASNAVVAKSATGPRRANVSPTMAGPAGGNHTESDAMGAWRHIGGAWRHRWVTEASERCVRVVTRTPSRGGRSLVDVREAGPTAARTGWDHSAGRREAGPARRRCESMLV